MLSKGPGLTPQRGPAELRKQRCPPPSPSLPPFTGAGFFCVCVCLLMVRICDKRSATNVRWQRAVLVP